MASVSELPSVSALRPGVRWDRVLRTPGSGTDRLCIGVELRRVVVGTGGGLSLAIKGLLDTLFARHPEHHYVLFGTIFNASLFDRAPDHVEVHTVPPTKWFYFTVDRLARERELDVLIRSFPTLDRMRFPLRRQIFVIPDLQHELFPEFFAPDVLADRRASFRRALAGAGAIATISEHSRQTLLQHPEAHGRDVFLMTPALQPEYASGTAAELSEAEQALLPRRPFFVYPANLWPHKNHRRLLAAFGRFRAETGADVELVLTGHPEGWADLASEFPGLPVRHLGFVQPALLRALLERATALVFFSLCEGFGMPLLEAFALGTPVICSNQGSLPEVGGDAVLTCDPTDVTAMSRLMARIVVDQPLRAELAARGRRRLDAYSWERSAESLLRACRRVAASPPGADPPEAEPVDPTAPPGSPSPRPLVSIVTPSYGQARFLGRTIASVLGQSYPDLEYIVIDGGSTDGSVDLLQQHGDRIRWTSEPDRGQSHALNKGFARARGEILAYLNADDVLAPGAVERAVTYLRDHPACDMVYGRAWFIDERDRLLEPYPTAPFSFERLMDDNCVCQPATFWRRRIAERVGGFDESLHIALDYQYWIRIVLAGGRIDYLPEVLALSRRHTEAKTWADRERTYSEIFTVCRRLTGRVSLSYFIGLWHYRVWEAPEGWPHRLRGHPRLTHWVARLHRIGYHLHYRRYLLRPRYGLPFLWSWLTGCWRALADWRLRTPSDPRSRPDSDQSGAAAADEREGERRWRERSETDRAPVYGVQAGDWLGPVCLVWRRAGPGEVVHLIGTAAVGTTLTVRVDGTPVGRYPLRGGVRARLEFALPPAHRQLVELRFASALTDDTGRRRAFHVEGTNLFAETDLPPGLDGTPDGGPAAP